MFVCFYLESGEEANEAEKVERYRRIWEELERGNGCDQNTLYGVFKEYIKYYLNINI